MFKRLLDPSLSRSFFLFGPRSTGKSTLLEGLLPESQALWLDLLDPDLERTLAQSPGRLTAILDQEAGKEKPRPWVVIDEIQKIPDLLSVVHKQIQKRRFRFALTGSSARKLRRGAANLLGGRASWYELFPLTHLELGDRFDLNEVLRYGALPEIFELEEAVRKELLRSYCSVYLKEEIIAEQLVRKVQPFRNFIELVALQNSQIINYSKFAKDCGVDITTIQTYFDILQDTLVGFELQPFHESIRKRQRANPKFFLFDTGVTRCLAGQIDESLTERTSIYGNFFEQFIIGEVYRLIHYYKKDWKMSYLTTKDDAEIDLILDRGKRGRLAIEIKSAERVDLKEVAVFERLAQDVPGAKLIWVSRDPQAQKHGMVECLYWRQAIEMIFRE